MRRSLWLIMGVVAVGCPAAEAPAAQRPNVLWITCEDLSPLLGCYGDEYAVTPSLDRFAKQGVRFDRAFASASVCTPARSCLITGVFASSLGTQHLRGPAQPPKRIRCFTEYLRRAGYYCSNNVKEDYNFKAPGAWDESSNKAHWRKRKPGQPFFSVFNIAVTHQGQIRYGREEFARVSAVIPQELRRNPARAPLPPYYPDTPVVRRIMAQLYTQVLNMDAQVGWILKQLDEDGLADDTIVFFYSDHGTGLPRGKRWLHDSGIRVPMIVRFPEKFKGLAPAKPGTAVERMVSFVDFAPTVLSLAGLEIPDYMQGRAFLGAAAAQPREYVFAIRDRVDEVYEFSRTVRDARYQYIRNYMPHRPRMQHSDYSERTPVRQELRRLAAEGRLEGTTAWLTAATKPAEELYDTQADPHQVNNLADSPDHRPILQRLRGKLREWMVRTRDTGLLPEAEMWRRTGSGSPYEMARTPGKFAVENVLAAAEQIGRDSTPVARLKAQLADKDAAVRYWAATSLLAIGDRALGAEKDLAKVLTDPSPAVRLAGAEAIWRLGGEKEARPVLIEGLSSSDPRVRLQAAIHLTALGPKIRSATPEIRKALGGRSGRSNFELYTRWALERLLAESSSGK